MTKLKLVLTLLLLSVFSKSFAQPGGLDASFAGKGLQTYTFKQNISSETPTATITDADGNIYIAGAETTNSTYAFVAKLLPSGKLDPSFGKNGKAILTEVSSPLFYPKAMALHPDGGIVLAGYITDPYPYYSTPCIVKLNASGVPQILDGKGTSAYYVSFSSFVNGADAAFTGIHILTNGDILATGDTGAGGDFFVAKITATGEPRIFSPQKPVNAMTLSTDSPADATCSYMKDSLVYMAGNNGSVIVIAAFNPSNGNMSTMFSGANGGQQTLPIASTDNNNFCTSIWVNATNHVILGGYAENVNTGNNHFLLYQLKPNGAFDFSKNYNLGNIAQSYSMVLDADEKIVLGGYLKDPGGAKNNNWTMIRTKKDGTLDATFGTSGSGIQTFTALPSGNGINCLLRQGTNYLLTGLNDNDVLVKKLDTKGSPVTTFATNSEYRLWLVDAESYITDMAVRPDGKLLVTGSYYDPTSSSLVAVLALLTKDGVLDPGFGGTGGADPGTINIYASVSPDLRSHLELTALQLQKDNQILLAGSYQASGYTDAFLVRLSTTGILDAGFNGGSGYFAFNAADSYIHDLAVQTVSGQPKILTYGFLNRNLTVIRIKDDGTLDVTFNSASSQPGVYTHPSTEYTSLTHFSDEKVELIVQPADQKIVCVGASFDSGADFLAFRLTPAGILDTDFGKSNDGIAIGDFGGNDYATSVCLKPNGSIVVGGYTNNKYGVMQLTPSGLLDTNFGTDKTGVQPLGKNYSQKILHLEAENNNTVIASGYMQVDDGSTKYISVLRITATGLFDNTFSGRGEATFGIGYSKNGALTGNSYYVAGSNDYFGTAADNGSYTGAGEMIKLKLGTGPVINISNLQLTDLQKTFGDEPFPLHPISNSSAPVEYSIAHGSCAMVNPTTGIVTIKCVPASPDQYIAIKAYQPAIPGFSEATAVVNLTVSKGIPKIIFNTQGGLVDSTILLRVVSNSNGDISFSIVQNDSYALNDGGSGNISILDVGCGTVQVTVGESQSYLEGTATAEVCGYEDPIPPAAFDDDIHVVYKAGVTGTVNVLYNDESYTSPIVTSEVDLDPSSAGIQNTFMSPAYGTFTVDTSGNVTYYPFEGFTGTGAISYTIHDAQGLVSKPGNINITQSIPQHELKATELITPNEDGLNDAFVIGYTNLKKQNKLKIYDRNGQELFTQANYKNDWTGELPNGKKAEAGIYYFVFQEGEDSNQRELKGVVELRR